MWRYVQASGELVAADGEIAAVGYAGFGEDKNRPESDGLKNKGPLPRGDYTVGPPRATTTHGPYVLPLIPDPANDMKHRDGFLVHGDATTRPGTASNGCLVMNRAHRTALWTSGDHVIRVVATHEDL